MRGMLRKAIRSGFGGSSLCTARLRCDLTRGMSCKAFQTKYGHGICSSYFWQLPVVLH